MALLDRRADLAQHRCGSDGVVPEGVEPDDAQRPAVEVQRVHLQGAALRGRHQAQAAARRQERDERVEQGWANGVDDDPDPPGGERRRVEVDHLVGSLCGRRGHARCASDHPDDLCASCLR
ncbi:MAG TPA: hypothetical protein VHZ06_08660 [Marmoricola sp.]|nr:hypothetical protein [Marmoricola sp.]